MYRNIVVPLDGSQNAASALDVAFALAVAPGCAIAFCTVVDAMEIAMSFAPGAKALGPWIQEVRREAAATLNLAASSARGKGITATATLLHSGPPAEAIVDYAKELDADAIVMGTHGRTGFARHLLGSVAREVLSKADCAVITVRPLQKRAVTGEIASSLKTDVPAI